MRDVDVELMLSYSRRPDTLGKQRSCSKPAVNSQTADAAATSTATHRVSSTQCLAAIAAVYTAHMRDSLSYGFTSHSAQNRSFQRRSVLLSQSLGVAWKKLNLTQ